MVTPERIFHMMNAHVATQALRGGLELGLFTAIAAGHATVPALAAHLGASERGTRILADYLCVTGLLTKADSAYSLAPDAALFLDANSPAYMGLASKFLHHPVLMHAASDIAQVVRTGRSILGGEGTIEDENPVWEDFARGMAPMMMPAAQHLAELAGSGPLRVLDIAAGHGIFGIHIAAQNPEAHITALDWPAVLHVAAENAARFGVTSRWTPLPGSALSVDYGSGYDLVLLTNFLHHFDEAGCIDILRRVHASLKPGGRVFTLEFVPNPDRVTPPSAAAFALTMLLNTPSGDAYTFTQFADMFRAAGFASTEQAPTGPLPEQVLVSVRR
jgi:2-polyprenyl-3-methyl-5-hydroxy-6-metoxy-1,4-benzoquinol methylase